MADQQIRPLTGIQRNNRIFACIWLFFEVFFCVMYGVYGRTVASDIFTTFGLFQYIAPVGIAIATVIGLGCIMSFVSGLKWSGIGFAFLILALCYQYYFLINAFWTKADIQKTTQNYLGATVPVQQYGDNFLIYLSEAPGILNKTFGCTATGAFKLALTIAIAFSAVVGRAGPLEILFFVFIGGFLYELNRQIISFVSYDVGGSTTVFMFGGIMGTVVALFLTLTKQKNDVVNRHNYTSSRFNATIGLLGAAFFWVFYPTIFLDLPLAVSTATQGPFMATNAMIIAYYAISATVVTSAALSAVINGRIRIKDLMYAPFAGAAIIGTSAVQITNPIAAILLGMIAGLLQPVFNIFEQRMSKNKVFFSTCAPFLFAVQGLLGALASGILRAIRNNQSLFNYGMYPYPFQWQEAGQFYRATFISFGIALGAGVLVAIFVYLVSSQQIIDYYQDRAYWIYKDDGLRPKARINAIMQDQELKGVHSYLG